MTNPELTTDIKLMPAELLSSVELQDFYAVRRNQTPDYAAWLNLEVAVAKAHEETPNGPTPREHFDRAYSNFAQVIDGGYANDRFKPFVLAQLALAAKPAFEAKVEKQPIDFEIMTNVHRQQLEVASTLTERFENRPDQPDVQGLFTSIVGMAILSSFRDSCWFPQLSSSRERLPHSVAHLAPLPTQEVPAIQRLTFVLQKSQRIRAVGAVSVDIGEIAAQSWADDDSQEDVSYDSEARRAGLLATLEALIDNDSSGYYNPRLGVVANQVWTAIFIGELKKNVMSQS